MHISDPKPPKAPAAMKITSQQYDGRRYMSVKLVWCPSRSNLPVEKYKIIWSLYVSSKEGSLITHEAYVKDVSRLEFPIYLSDLYTCNLTCRRINSKLRNCSPTPPTTYKCRRCP